MKAEIDDCKFVLLRNISETEEGSLRLVVEEAKIGRNVADSEFAHLGLQGKRLIESDINCRSFHVTWPSYMAYSVRNEVFVAEDKSEMWEGRLLRKYSNSHFRDYVAKATFANDEYPGPYRHWGVNCLNHIVDVVSTADPTVSCVRTGESS